MPRLGVAGEMWPALPQRAGAVLAGLPEHESGVALGARSRRASRMRPSLGLNSSWAMTAHLEVCVMARRDMDAGSANSR